MATGSNFKVQPFIVILTAVSIFCASVRAVVATPIPDNRNESYHGIRSRLPRRNIWRYYGGRHGFLCFSFPVWTIVAIRYDGSCADIRYDFKALCMPVTQLA
jgi:hypothetical protein